MHYNLFRVRPRLECADCRAQRRAAGAAGRSAAGACARRSSTSPEHFDNSRLVKASDPVRVREMRVFSAAVAVLFSLIMIYGLQHFYAIESSYRVESEKQGARAVARGQSPVAPERSRAHAAGRIDQMARQLGLDAPQPGQVVIPTLRPRLRRSGTWPRSHLPAPAASVEIAFAVVTGGGTGFIPRHAGSRSSHSQPRQPPASAVPLKRRASGSSASSFCCGPAPSRAPVLAADCAPPGVCRARPKQQQRTFEVAPRRGVLYDRNLRELAMTVLADSIYADPTRSPTSRPPRTRSPRSCTPILTMH
jgi:hypothetical protein